jgi:hypothetical protein
LVQFFLSLLTRSEDSKQKTNRKDNLPNARLFSQEEEPDSHPKLNFRCKRPQEKIFSLRRLVALALQRSSSRTLEKVAAGMS